MIKKLLQKTVVFSSLSLLILFLLNYLTPLSQSASLVKKYTLLSPNPTQEAIVFAALPETNYQTQASFQTADARPEIVRQYLARYGSELEPYSELIVSLSDQNDFDYRWLVAIAQQESNLCKKIPYNSHNCWGWGIYGDKVTRFDSYEHALTTIAPRFKQTFLKDKHLKDPYEVMQTYTPPSNGSWAAAVLQFFKELE